MQKEKIKYIMIFFSITMSIFIYGKIRCLLKNNKHFKDPLSKNVNIYMDGWLLSHFILFSFIGYHFSNSFYLSMTLGILWEFIEVMIGTLQPMFLLNIAKCTKINLKKKDIIDVNSEDLNWFYGRYEDIIVDFLGFITGYFIKNYNFKELSSFFNVT